MVMNPSPEALDLPMDLILDKPYERFIPEAFDVPVEPLLRIQGYRDLAAVRPDVRAIAERMAARATACLAPEAFHRRVPIAGRRDDLVVLDGGTSFRSAALSKSLAGCESLTVFVLTLGPAIDAETQALLLQSDIVEALFLETAGWIAVERATKALARHLQERAAERGEGLSRRLAPGYADWPLQDQAPLFALLQAAPLPVRLLESCAMKPKNSRSGVYGLRAAARREQ